MIEYALELAKKGFHVFPIVPNTKDPAIKGFPTRATRSASQIRSWWVDPVLELEQPFNIGISTTRFEDDAALLAVDVDNKGKKKGDEELLKLELQGFDFPQTFTQKTPSGGLHLIYKVPQAVKQGVNVLGNGLDIRSKGGYLVGVGSTIGEIKYRVSTNTEVAPAPDWLIKKCGAAKLAVPKPTLLITNIDQDRAIGRAQYYLSCEAKVAVEGEGGDSITFAVAARVKDFGVSKENCLSLMLDHWNNECQPPWSVEELQEKVEHAYQYGHDPIGVAAPEVQFKPIPVSPDDKEHPVRELNKEYAFVLTGGEGHILWETTGPKGEFSLQHIGIQSFRYKLAAQRLLTGEGRYRDVTDLWMKSPLRRSYDGICFRPGLKCPSRFYNLWRGFAVDPIAKGSTPSPEARASLDKFLEHARENVCAGKPELFRWLMGYFAHMIQKPWEKPLVALVFRGKKGVGKNALIGRVGHLLGSHYLLASNRRYLIGNFNSHLENLLFFALDEAFWSGDKQAEGILKDVITGSTHLIEHKGRESYTVENCTRVAILGNEDWLVPASQDERRFAVFNVGDGKKQDGDYFQSMIEGMEAGGYELLLRYLLDYDLTGIKVNQAPATDGLRDQKLSSLDGFHEWWLECLTEGRISGTEFSDDWPEYVNGEQIRSAFRQYVQERQIRSRIEDARVIGKTLKDCLPSLKTVRRMQDGSRKRGYFLPKLSDARKEWDTFIGHECEWESEDD